jgi:hypothetical protein
MVRKDSFTVRVPGIYHYQCGKSPTKTGWRM